VRECWWVLEWHWRWADVQIEGSVERDARVRKVEGCPRRSEIVVYEESTYR
jgi:hypothetical protein